MRDAFLFSFFSRKKKKPHSLKEEEVCYVIPWNYHDIQPYHVPVHFAHPQVLISD